MMRMHGKKNRIKNPDNEKDFLNIMKTPKEIVEVSFRIFPSGEVIALFPALPWNNSEITSYMILGQHGGASQELLNELPNANLEESRGIKDELIEIGYSFKII